MKNFIPFYKKFLFGIFLIICVQSTNELNAQSKKADSLKILLKKERADTIQIKILQDLGIQYLGTRPDSSLYFHSKALQLAQKQNSKLRKANAMRYVAWDLYVLGKTDESIKMHNEGLNLCNGFLEDNKGNSDASKNGLTVKASLLSNMGIVYAGLGKFPEAINSYTMAAKMFEQIPDTHGIAGAVYGVGNIYFYWGDYPNALKFFNKTLELCKTIHLEDEACASLIGIANIHVRQGNYPKAIQMYLQALEIKEKSNNSLDAAKILANIGVIYNSIKDNDKALEYYNKALKIYRNNGIHNGIGSCLGNIGLVLVEKGNYEEARKIYQEALKSIELDDDKFSLANILASMANLEAHTKNIPAGIEFYDRSIQLQRELKDENGLAINLSSLGALYILKKDYKKAKVSIEEGLAIAKKIGSVSSLSSCYSNMASLDSALGNYKGAYSNHKLFVFYRDSLTSEENTKKTLEQHMRFDFAKKQAADSVSHVKEKEIQEAIISKQEALIKVRRNQQYALYGGLILVIVFASFMYYRFRITNKQKIIIELQEKKTQEQKLIIEEKHKEITDSINYAERILRSFLATEKLLSENLNNYFILFQPKAVVSGDFYWASRIMNGKFVYVTADSTGHGVPGAIMSILNITSLEKAIETETESSAILNSTRRTIIDRLKNDGSESGGKDGMDCSLVILTPSEKQSGGKWGSLNYSAANSPVWVVRSNPQNKQPQIIELPYDKMPVGKHDKDMVSFSDGQFELIEGDMIYTFTDGFADQFGGPKGKKFMYKQLKEILVSNANKPLQEQKSVLLSTINDWKGTHEQVDDITLIGIRV